MRHFSVILLFATSILSLAAADKTPGPEVLVTRLYKVHDSDQSPFFQTKDRALVDRYFAKELAELMWKDAKASDGELGVIDFDPLYDAQDLEIKDLAISTVKAEGGKATVVAAFVNMGTKTRVTFKLVKEADAWKIRDIEYAAGHTLLTMFKDAARN